MGQWTLPGPDAMRMGKGAILELLGISGDTLDRMIVDGRFPRGIKPSSQSQPFWTGADLAAWLHLSERMRPEEKEAKEKS